MRVSIATWIFFLLAGATIPTLAAQRRSASIDERAVADFYRGKVVRIVVGFPPGGGADVYSRVLARHLGRFIPGSPTLAVTNMPGAGSMIAGNYIYNAGAKDGTEIGMLNGAVILEQLFGNPGIHFDMARFRYLAVPVTETYVMIVARRSGVARFSEVVGANAKQVVIGAIPNSTLEHAPILRSSGRESKSGVGLQRQRGYSLGHRLGGDRRFFQSLEHSKNQLVGKVHRRPMVGYPPS